MAGGTKGVKRKKSKKFAYVGYGYPCDKCEKIDKLSCNWRDCVPYRRWFKKEWRRATERFKGLK